MGQPLEVHIRKLQEFYWSDGDPDGRGFVPLADALRTAGDLREAHRLLREGLGRHPDFLSAYVVWGWLWVDRGQMENAESSFRTALELDSRNISALRGLAKILLERGETGSALSLLETLSHEDPIDLDLPQRILDIRAQASALDGREPDSGPDPKPPIWTDASGVADDLNLETATLQEDSSPAASFEQARTESPSESIVEDGEPIPDQEDLDGAMVTSTLGEIYLRQGLFDRAQSVFETLLERDPENEHLKHRLGEAHDLQRAREAGEEEFQDDRYGVPTGDVVPEAVVPVEELAPEDAVPEEEGPLPVDVVPIESLAPDRVRAAVVVEPEAEPDPIVSIDTLAPVEPTPIEELAPDEVISFEPPAPGDPVPIWSLAFDDPVAIESLAPDGPIPVESLAPGPSTEPSSHGLPEVDESKGDPTVEAFENWLEELP